MRALVVLSLTLLAFGEAGAQDPALATIERMVALGRADEARDSLGRWWDASYAGASGSDRQRSLWLRGRLTVDPVQAARDFRRLAVEYPGGIYTDQAVFRLAQVAYATGDASGAERHVENLERDYPASPILAEARAWLISARAGVPVAVAAAPAGRSAAASTPSGGESDAGATGTGADSVAGGAPPAADSVGTTARYAVQLGAFSTRERAETLRESALQAGLDVRIVRVRGSNLYHVRAGTFDSSGEAGVFFRQVTERGFTAAVVRDADKEEPARE